jgi:DNA-directed RNA polymerase omega subunit
VSGSRRLGNKAKTLSTVIDLNLEIVKKLIMAELELDELTEQAPPPEIDSKYRLIILAAKRSKQLQRGARARIEIDATKHKPTRIALEEVIQGRIPFHIRPDPNEAASEE